MRTYQACAQRLEECHQHLPVAERHDRYQADEREVDCQPNRPLIGAH